jgi:hypothetical protein
MKAVGLSMALGAFLAGVCSPKANTAARDRHRAVPGRCWPFFIAVGMNIDFQSLTAAADHVVVASHQGRRSRRWPGDAIPKTAATNPLAQGGTRLRRLPDGEPGRGDLGAASSFLIAAVGSPRWCCYRPWWPPIMVDPPAASAATVDGERAAERPR